jgi:hypothetical protein
MMCFRRLLGEAAGDGEEAEEEDETEDEEDASERASAAAVVALLTLCSGKRSGEAAAAAAEAADAVAAGEAAGAAAGAMALQPGMVVIFPHTAGTVMSAAQPMAAVFQCPCTYTTASRGRTAPNHAHASTASGSTSAHSYAPENPKIPTLPIVCQYTELATAATQGPLSTIK